MALLLFTLFLVLCLTLPCLSVNQGQVFQEIAENRFLQIEETIRLQAEQIETLQNTVQDQQIQIHMQKLQAENQNRQIQNLRTLVKLQNKKILSLKIKKSRWTPEKFEHNQHLTIKANRTDVKTLDDVRDRVEMHQHEIKNHQEHKIKNHQVPLHCARGRRLLIGSGTVTPPTRTPAFFAYLSHHELGPGNHHILILDTVKTNTDGSYSGFTGVFTTPVDGIYGFIYTIRIGCHTTRTLGTFELVRNTIVEGVEFIEDNTCYQVTVTGNVIIHANQGDKIYVRTHSSHPIDSNIYSDENGRTSFAGWLIQPDQ